MYRGLSATSVLQRAGDAVGPQHSTRSYSPASGASPLWRPRFPSLGGSWTSRSVAVTFGGSASSPLLVLPSACYYGVSAWVLSGSGLDSGLTLGDFGCAQPRRHPLSRRALPATRCHGLYSRLGGGPGASGRRAAACRRSECKETHSGAPSRARRAPPRVALPAIAAHRPRARAAERARRTGVKRARSWPTRDETKLVQVHIRAPPPYSIAWLFGPAATRRPAAGKTAVRRLPSVFQQPGRQPSERLLAPFRLLAWLLPGC